MRVTPNFYNARKLPAILAAETSECGLACIAMISAYYGGVDDLLTLRRTFEVSLKGTTAKNIVTIASAMGFSTRVVKAEIETARLLRLPCILHWEMNHFVVLDQIRRDRFFIVDPSIGRRELSREQFSDQFTGVAIEMMPTASWQGHQKTSRVPFSKFVGRLLGARQAFAQIALLALTMELCALAYPYLLQWIVDGAIAGADVELLVSLGISFGVVIGLQSSLFLLRGRLVSRFSADINLQWMTNIFDHLISLPVPFFEKRQLGDVINKFNSVPNIQRAISTTFIEATIDGMLAVGTLAMIFVFIGYAGFLPLLGIIVIASARLFHFHHLRSSKRETLLHGARQQSHLIETIRGIQAVKLFNKGHDRMSGWLNHLISQINSDASTQEHILRQRSLAVFVSGAERVAFISIVGWQAIQGSVTIGAFFALAAYREQFVARSIALLDRAFELGDVGVQLERLSDIVLETAHARPFSIVKTQRCTPTLELQNVSFAYSPLELPVLQNVSLIFHAGQSVALTGPSGCGKTTLAKLILGLLSPSSGRICLDGQSLHDVPVGDSRRLVSAVMQDDSLFIGTILQNITFFDAPPDITFAMDCARAAAIHVDIESMPMKYYSHIGDMGSTLSGGQRQRLLLARALYSKPSILVLDEATSQLDVANEALVNQSVSAMSLTRIIIAHRAETIRSANRVIRLEGGRVVSDTVDQIKIRA